MKRLFTRRTAGTDAKVDRLVMEYARRSAASPLLQHTERLVLDRSEGIAHLSSVGKHTAERRCSLPSAAPACSTRSRRDCYRRLLPPGRTMPRRAMRSRCAGRTARRSALPAAMTARAFRTAGQSLPPRQIPCCASIRRASCSTRRAQPPRRGRCFTAPWNSSRTAHATPTAPKTGRWRPVSLWSFRPGRMRTSCWAGSSRCRPVRPRTRPTRPRRQSRSSAAPHRRIFWSSANSCKEKAGPDAAFRCRIGSFLRFTILLPGRSSPASGLGS